MDSPWYFGMWWSKLDFNSNSSVLPCAAVGYWIHKGVALSNPEAASSLSVQLSMAMSCTTSPTCAVGISSSSGTCSSRLGSRLSGLDSCWFLLRLKVLSKSSSKSKICSRTGWELRVMH
ncbi:hypothetical protein ACFX14_032247 [Malus domestica]